MSVTACTGRKRDCVRACHLFFTRPHRDTARRHRELWFTPLQLLKRGQPRGREIALAYYDGMNITHSHADIHTHKSSASGPSHLMTIGSYG